VNIIKNDRIELNFKLDVEKLKDMNLIMKSVSLNGAVHLTGDKSKGFIIREISLN
jgi:hypothetical protein